MLQSILSWLLSALMTLLSVFGVRIGSLDPAPTPVVINEQTIAYGTAENQDLDLYLPVNKSGAVGLLLFLHGGAWVSGNKTSYTADARNWSRAGYAAATMNYRYLSSGGGISAELDDVGAALGAIKTAAADSGIRIGKVILVGISAGAHLALCYAYSRKNTAPVTPVAVVSSSAPTDFTDPAFMSSASVSAYVTQNLGIDPTLVASLMQSELAQVFLLPLRAISPAQLVTKDTVPTLFAHGKQDTLVPYSNAERLNSALTANGVKHDFVTFPNSGHTLLGDPDCAAQMQTLMQQYVAAYLD